MVNNLEMSRDRLRQMSENLKKHEQEIRRWNRSWQGGNGDADVRFEAEIDGGFGEGENVVSLGRGSLQPSIKSTS